METLIKLSYLILSYLSFLIVILKTELINFDRDYDGDFSYKKNK